VYVSMNPYFLLFIVCLRRLTFFQQPKKVSKKGRPSSAGKADFSQIPLKSAKDEVAYQHRCFYKVKCWMEFARKIMMALPDRVWILFCILIGTKRAMPSIFVLGFLMFIPHQSLLAAEVEADSSKAVNIPRRAMLRSLALPGWGQFYNKKKIKGSVIAAAEIGSTVAYFVKRDRLRSLASAERNVYFFSTIAIVLYSMGDAYVDAYLNGVNWAEVEIGVGNEGGAQFRVKFKLDRTSE
jgi:hypothetical protein